MSLSQVSHRSHNTLCTCQQSQAATFLGLAWKDECMADNATEQPERLGPPACHAQSGVNQWQPQAAQRELLLIQQVSKQLLGTSSVLDAQRPTVSHKDVLQGTHISFSKDLETKVCPCVTPNYRGSGSAVVLCACSFPTVCRVHNEANSPWSTQAYMATQGMQSTTANRHFWKQHLCLFCVIRLISSLIVRYDPIS